MPAYLQPVKRIKCTFSDCTQSFDSEKAMRSHKKYSEEHDYCHKCDEDFNSYDELAQHKAFRPDNHGKACRVCGDEFKSTSGLKRHIEWNHKVDQILKCIGCGDEFYRASLLIEHLEFGHCEQIEALEFQGHIVHKYLVTELLKGGPAYERFMQKMAKFDAAIDHDKEGGVGLDPVDQDIDEAQQVDYAAIKPDLGPEVPIPSSALPFPPLPSKTSTGSDACNLGSKLETLSISGDLTSQTDVTSIPSSVYGHSSPTDVASIPSSGRTLKAWGSRNGKSASNTLFPNAKPTPALSEFSISHHDDTMEQEHGINIMRTRFWDPVSDDWNPERFWDAITEKFYCPFICEQTFPIPSDLVKHIMNDHRITRVKCPRCHKHFKSCTALMSHCENPGDRCRINKAEDFNIYLDRLTGGFLGVEEKVHPHHINNPSVLVRNRATGEIEPYTPPVASYLQYGVTKPPDWKERQATITIGSGCELQNKRKGPIGWYGP